MKRSEKDAASNREVEMQFTPMIDVTFLLLIFFLCTIKFKLLDSKVATHLPPDGTHAGLNAPFEKIEIYLIRDEKGPDGFRVSVNGETQRCVEALFVVLRDLQNRDPTLEVVIHTGEGILHGHVVTVVNECLRAGLRDIAFSRRKNQGR